MWNLRRNREKIIAVTGDEKAVTFTSQPEDVPVWRSPRQYLTQLEHFVAKCSERILNIVRDIVIEQESHGVPEDIWRAISTSISPR